MIEHSNPRGEDAPLWWTNDALEMLANIRENSDQEKVNPMTKITRKKATVKILELLERRQQLEEAMERLQDKLDNVNEELRIEMEKSDG